MNKCIRCGTEKELTQYKRVWFKISENLLSSLDKYEQCFVCKDCIKKAVKYV